jgi:hypothetical protein
MSWSTHNQEDRLKCRTLLWKKLSEEMEREVKVRDLDVILANAKTKDAEEETAE